MAPAPLTPEQQEELMRVETRLEISYDEFRGITFVSHQYESGRYTSVTRVESGNVSIYPYIGYDDSSKWMFLKATYQGRDWLFMDQVYVVSDDWRYNTPRYPSHLDLVQRDSGGGQVREIIHFRARDPGVEEMIRAVSSVASVTSPGFGKDIRIRFQGSRGTIDFDLGPLERSAWEDILFYFDHLEQTTR